MDLLEIYVQYGQYEDYCQEGETKAVLVLVADHVVVEERGHVQALKALHFSSSFQHHPAIVPFSCSL